MVVCSFPNLDNICQTLLTGTCHMWIQSCDSLKVLSHQNTVVLKVNGCIGPWFWQCFFFLHQNCAFPREFLQQCKTRILKRTVERNGRDVIPSSSCSERPPMVNCPLRSKFYMICKSPVFGHANIQALVILQSRPKLFQLKPPD